VLVNDNIRVCSLISFAFCSQVQAICWESRFSCFQGNESTWISCTATRKEACKLACYLLYYLDVNSAH